MKTTTKYTSDMVNIIQSAILPMSFHVSLVLAFSVDLIIGWSSSNVLRNCQLEVPSTPTRWDCVLNAFSCFPVETNGFARRTIPFAKVGSDD